MKKISFKRIGIIALAVIIVLIALRFIFYRETLWIGLALLLAGLIAFLVWKAFVKNGREDLRRSERKGKELEEEVTCLKKEIAGLYRELEEKGRSPLNVVELSPILHLAVMNIDSSFVRTFIREDEDAGLTFNGALRADICAEYGVRLEDVRFKYEPDSDTLYVAGFNPGIISYSRKRLTWDLSNTFRSRSLLGISLPPVNDKVAEDFTHKMTESIRAEVEAEIDNRRVKEFDWLEPVVSRQIIDVLRVAVCGPKTRINVLEDPAGEGFVGIDELYRSHVAAAPQIQS